MRIIPEYTKSGIRQEAEAIGLGYARGPEAIESGSALRQFHTPPATWEAKPAERFPLHVTRKWIGNSSTIAAKHYLQVTDEHFALAAHGAEPETAQKATQNPAQQVLATGGMTRMRKCAKPLIYRPMRANAKRCEAGK